jgi:dihydroorotate dehydrogenase
MGLIADMTGEARRALLTARLILRPNHLIAEEAIGPLTVPVHAFGLSFPGPLGVAAGVDRNGKLSGRLFSAGFSFVEVGTVTPDPWFLRNPGATAVAGNLAERRGIVAVSVGSRRPGLGEEAAGDCLAAMRATADVADFFVLNMSSPLRRGGGFAGFLTQVRDDAPHGRPLLVKADVADPRCGEILRAARAAGYDGASAVADAAGLAAVTREHPAWPLISVGGVASTADVHARRAAGATLVQVCGALLRGGIIQAAFEDDSSNAKRTRATGRAAPVGAECRRSLNNAVGIRREKPP